MPDLSRSDSGPALLYQCPGCWGYYTCPKPAGGFIECECGERATLIDLRARTKAGPHGAAWHEDERRCRLRTIPKPDVSQTYTPVYRAGKWGSPMDRIGGHGSPRPEFRRRMRCAYCDGDGTICNPGNLDPSVRIRDWLYPVACGRCGGTGVDPDQSDQRLPIRYD